DDEQALHGWESSPAVADASASNRRCPWPAGRTITPGLPRLRLWYGRWPRSRAGAHRIGTRRSAQDLAGEESTRPMAGWLYGASPLAWPLIPSAGLRSPTT